MERNKIGKPVGSIDGKITMRMTAEQRNHINKLVEQGEVRNASEYIRGLIWKDMDKLNEGGK